MDQTPLEGGLREAGLLSASAHSALVAGAAAPGGGWETWAPRPTQMAR